MRHSFYQLTEIIMQSKTLINSPYDTLPLLGLNTKTQNYAEEIYKLYQINQSSDAIEREENIFILRFDNAHIHTFLHPVLYNDKVYADARAYYNRQQRLNNFSEYLLIKKRAKLLYHWNKNREYFTSVERLIVDAFSSWVSFRLQHTTNCNILTSTHYRIVAAIYYLGLLTYSEHFSNENCIIYILKHIPPIINIPTQVVNDLITLDEETIITVFRHIDDNKSAIHILAEAITKMTDGETLITPSVMYNSCCRNAFISSNSLEIATISMEYVPDFIAMLQLVATRGLQNKTGLGKILLSIQRKHDMLGFDKFVERVTQ